MVRRIKIKTKTSNDTHFEYLDNYTLCGIELVDNKDLGIKIGETMSKPVNCQQCVHIVEFCKNRKSKEFERTVPINRPYTVPYSKIFNQLGIDGDISHDETMNRINNFVEMQNAIKRGIK